MHLVLLQCMALCGAKKSGFELQSKKKTDLINLIAQAKLKPT
jgi:hypothetical protein